MNHIVKRICIFLGCLPFLLLSFLSQLPTPLRVSLSPSYFLSSCLFWQSSLGYVKRTLSTPNVLWQFAFLVQILVWCWSCSALSHDKQERVLPRMLTSIRTELASFSLHLSPIGFKQPTKQLTGRGKKWINELDHHTLHFSEVSCILNIGFQKGFGETRT